MRKLNGWCGEIIRGGIPVSDDVSDAIKAIDLAADVLSIGNRNRETR